MKKGDKVHWNWGKGQGEGTIVEKSESTIKKKIKGTEVERKANKEEPAYVIKQAKGNEVVKSESELTAGGKAKKPGKKKLNISIKHIEEDPIKN